MTDTRSRHHSRAGAVGSLYTPLHGVGRPANGDTSMIRFGCPVCKTVLTVSDDKVGKKSKCPGCGQRLQVPAPSEPAVEGERESPFAVSQPEAPAALPNVGTKQRGLAFGFVLIGGTAL